MERNSFIFYRSFSEAIRQLDEHSQCIVYRAIIDYGLDGIEPILEGIPAVVWTLIKPQLDANWRRFLNGCKGGEYGVRGGAPKGNQNAKKQPQDNPENNPETAPNQPQNNPKTTPNDNVNDNVNDNEKIRDVSNETSLSHFADAKRDDAKSRFDAKKFVEFFNKTMSEANANIPRLRSLQGTRLQLVTARINQYSKQDVFEVVCKAAKSDFLNGRVGTSGKSYGIDWIMLPNNFPKVLEGNYDNRATRNGAEQHQDDRRGTKADNIPLDEYDKDF